MFPEISPATYKIAAISTLCYQVNTLPTKPLFCGLIVSYFKLIGEIGDVSAGRIPDNAHYNAIMEEIIGCLLYQTQSGHQHNVVSMLEQRHRRWNNNTTLLIGRVL